MTYPSDLKEQLRRHLEDDLVAAKLAAGKRESQRNLLLERKSEIVATQQKWIEKHIALLKKYSRSSVPQHYVPSTLRFVPCQEQWHHDLWRLCKLTYWSMPPNEYVGRRLRVLVFDGDYLFGLIGLASCVWGLTARDRWVGWSLQQKTMRLSLVADAYVLGAVPPYNGDYRGSKLLAYLVASKQVQDLWQHKYSSPLAAVVTTTLFGHSAVLNRVRHADSELWHKVGYTRGLGTMHFSLETVNLAKDLLASTESGVPNRLTSGPNWKLRLMRTAIEAVGLKAEEYLSHGYRRGIYIMECGYNTQDFLRGNNRAFYAHNYGVTELLHSWEARNAQRGPR